MTIVVVDELQVNVCPLRVTLSQPLASKGRGEGSLSQWSFILPGLFYLPLWYFSICLIREERGIPKGKSKLLFHWSPVLPRSPFHLPLRLSSVFLVKEGEGEHLPQSAPIYYLKDMCEYTDMVFCHRCINLCS